MVIHQLGKIRRHIYDATLDVKVDKTINKVWVASPDIEFGVIKSIYFTQSGNLVKFTLPKLKYWDMIVMNSKI